MRWVDSIVKKALRYQPEYMGQTIPSFNFELGPHFGEFNLRSVSQRERPLVSARLTEAFLWCADRFPLCITNASNNTTQQTITQFTVGRSVHRNELLTASSAQAAGIVLIAARWPVKTFYRLGSLIAHESMHQALYVRENLSSPVRPRSFGYSPWKNSLRPGRLVWHSFWTFVCQFTMLSESVLDDNQILQMDPKLIAFLADMQARILVCHDSLRTFELVTSEELEKCDEALSILDEVARESPSQSNYQQHLAKARKSVFEEFDSWAHRFIEQQTITEADS